MKQFGDAPKYLFISSPVATHLGPPPLFLADLQGRCPPTSGVSYSEAPY